jgi:hypothetical protein
LINVPSGRRRSGWSAAARADRIAGPNLVLVSSADRKHAIISASLLGPSTSMIFA